MAAYTEAMILQALTDHLTALAFIPVLPIVHQGIDFPAAGQTKPANYLSLTFLPNQTRQVTIGDDPQQKRGMLQVSVFWKRGQGVIKPLDVAGQIINHFKNHVLFASGIRITIDPEPWAAGPLQDDDRVQVPVTIPFHAFEPET